ncbi:hypothetical protein M885DRAFT_520486 [Pelagophyceae sp. CCMP2097]|nr:hypothetical protein M885DRAFT_520486 [Pelagophyceae sp. CCMP2097]
MCLIKEWEFERHGGRDAGFRSIDSTVYSRSLASVQEAVCSRPLAWSLGPAAGVHLRVAVKVVGALGDHHRLLWPALVVLRLDVVRRRPPVLVRRRVLDGACGASNVGAARVGTAKASQRGPSGATRRCSQHSLRVTRPAAATRRAAAAPAPRCVGRGAVRFRACFLAPFS